MRSVPRVGILIVCDVPRLAILIVQRTFYHLVTCRRVDILKNYFVPGVGNLNLFLNENVKIPTPMPELPPSLGLNIDRCITMDHIFSIFALKPFVPIHFQDSSPVLYKVNKKE